MSELMKKNAEMNELLAEVKDMDLDAETGAGLSDINPIVTFKYRCGLVRTLSAECWPGHKSCNPFNK